MSEKRSDHADNDPAEREPSSHDETAESVERPREYGGRKDGLDPTRYGDWEKNGRCIDF